MRAVALYGLLGRRKPDTVYGWLTAYQAGGPAALVQRPRGHRGFPPSCRADELLRVLHQAPERFGVIRTRWRLVDLQCVLGWLGPYTLSGIGHALHRLGVRPKRGRLSVHSPDPHYQENVCTVEQAVGLARRFPERVRVVYADEMSLYRQPLLGPVALPRGQIPVAPLSHCPTTRFRVSGAVDVRSGQVTWTSASKMRVPRLCQFLEQVRGAYPASVVFLVWDTWPVHPSFPRYWPPPDGCGSTYCGCPRMRLGPIPSRSCGGGSSRHSWFTTTGPITRMNSKHRPMPFSISSPPAQLIWYATPDYYPCKLLKCISAGVRRW